MSIGAWIPVEQEKWYVGWEIEEGKIYYVHSSSQGIPRHNALAAPVPPLPLHKTVIWTQYIMKANSYPTKASAVGFVVNFLRKGKTYALFGFKGEMLKHMEQITVSGSSQQMLIP